MTASTPGHDRMTCASHPYSEHSARETVILGVANAIRYLAFWTAILVPLIIVPAVLAGAVSSYPHAFFGLLALNVVCLVAGHGHRPRNQ